VLADKHASVEKLERVGPVTALLVHDTFIRVGTLHGASRGRPLNHSKEIGTVLCITKKKRRVRNKK
jgi:hypothetical protein